MSDSHRPAARDKSTSPRAGKGRMFSVAIKNILLYAGIIVFAVWCFMTFRADIARISLDDIWTARNAVMLAASLSLLNYLLRTVRWSIYLRHFGYRFSASFTCLAYVAGFAFTLSPGKVGEMVRARYFKDVGVPVATTAAAFFVERALDMLALSGLALAGLAVASGYGVVLVSGVAVIAGMLAVFALTPWESCQAWLGRRRSIRASMGRVFDMLDFTLRVMLSARTLLQPGMLAIGFSIGILAWGAEGLGLMVLGAMAPAVPLDWASATGIYAIAIIVGALSFLPGGLGSTEVVMIALLAAHGYPMPQAILLTMVCRILTLWLAVMLGWIAVLVLRHYPEPAGATS